MKERPILFSAPMVKAILAGNKSQTRRVAKHSLLQTLSYVVNIGDGWFGDEEGDVQVLCPYGKVGDQLWVKETWLQPGAEPVIYKADDWAEELVAKGKDNPAYPQLKWKSPLFMPRRASRIQLEITGIRIQQLKDCTPQDAIEEGIICQGAQFCGVEGITPWRPGPVEAYRDLWEHINGAGSWDANPWVWVIEFKRIDKAA